MAWKVRNKELEVASSIGIRQMREIRLFMKKMDEAEAYNPIAFASKLLTLTDEEILYFFNLILKEVGKDWDGKAVEPADLDFLPLSEVIEDFFGQKYTGIILYENISPIVKENIASLKELIGQELQQRLRNPTT